jgi:hypothetical protein
MVFSAYILPPFQVIRRFDFGQSQTALNLTKFLEKIITFLAKDKFIMKIYSIIDLMKLIWYYKYYYICLS